MRPAFFMMKKHSDDDYFYWAVFIAVFITIGCTALLMTSSRSFATCWIYQYFGMYCPACGGTRAVLALCRGQIGLSLYHNTVVVVLAIFVLLYLPVQTICRLKGKQVPVWCRYRPMWLYGFIGLLLANCLIRNILWLAFQIPI